MKKLPTYEELVLFKNVYEAKSLSKAASMLGMPISSASHMLSRLRDFFGDSLFVKTGVGVVPTAKAEQLIPKVLISLRSSELLIKQPALDLHNVNEVIKISCADDSPIMLLSNFPNKLKKSAPNISVVFEQFTRDRLERLRKKELDFVVSPTEGVLSEGYYSIPLGINHYVLVCGNKHPLAKLEKKYPEGIPDEEIGKYSFIDIYLDRLFYGATTLRRWVCPQWSTFNSNLMSAYFLPCIPMLESTDLLMVLPKRVTDRLTGNFKFKVLNTLTKPTTNQPKLIWHEVIHNDPLRQWIRSVIKDTIE